MKIKVAAYRFTVGGETELYYTSIANSYRYYEWDTTPRKVREGVPPRMPLERLKEVEANRSLYEQHRKALRLYRAYLKEYPQGTDTE